MRLLVTLTVAASALATGCLCTPKKVPGSASLDVAAGASCPSASGAKDLIEERQGDIESVESGPDPRSVSAQCCYAHGTRGTPTCIDVTGDPPCPSPGTLTIDGTGPLVVRWSWAHTECRYDIIDHDWADVCG
jgi:hypothetical protein